MSPFVLLLNISKLVGVAGALTVAANSIAFRSFRRRNLGDFPLTIDETEDVLASFPVDKDVDDGGFFFALATAPAHVEDKLDDAWLRFAQEDVPEEQHEGEQEGVPDVQEREAGQEVVEGAEEKGEPRGATASSAEEQRIAEQSSLSGGGEKVEGGGEEGGSDSSVGTSEVLKQLNDELVSLKEERKSSAVDDDWEVVAEGADRDTPSAKEEGKAKTFRSDSLVGEPFFLYPDGKEEKTVRVPLKATKARGTTLEPTLEYNQINIPFKVKKTMKVAMEAMLRGIEKFSEEEEKHNVAAWHNAKCPEERLRFWSEPDTELKLAQGTNVSVFRMGIDWNRIVPEEPISGTQKVADWQAVKRYRWILQRVRDHGMRVMLTLFHHSLPPWAAVYGGWKEKKTADYFVEFTRLAVDKFGDLVDYWITFNEPHVFAMLTYCAGAWPGGDPNMLEVATSIMPRGIFKKAMGNMAIAHNKAYDIIHAFSKENFKRAKVGVSHHISFMRPYGLFDVNPVILSNWMTRFAFVDDIAHKLDYLGINYYGQEVVSLPGLKLVETDEFSESGRGVYPDGLYRLLMQFYQRYKKHGFSYIITENGVSDESDYIRRPYMVEHLLAVRAAMNQGVPIKGYCFWTTSDNWEWADGYGPKFGLAAVDRENNLKRILRPSYHLFAEIVKTGKVTKQQRETAWEELMAVAREGRTRPFCRAVDGNGLMYAGGLDIPIQRQFAQRDWRFGHYQVEGLQDPLSCLLRSLAKILLLGHGRKSKNQQPKRLPEYPQPAQVFPSNAPSSADKAVAGAAV